MIDQKSFSPGQTPEQKYQLLMELGRGGMGVASLAVFRGPQGFAKLVVLKTMRKQLVGDAELHRMFLEEARLSARLTHPNIVHVYEITEYDHAPTLVMEYLEGQTLWQMLQSAGQALPLPLHLHILTKVLAGLHAAHELRDYNGKPLNLIHRDVSPHNVCVLFDGQVKVLDFGIAKTTTSEVETAVGQWKGKARYMPPEQMMRGDQDRRVDVFAVGVMLWEAIMRRRYWGETPEADVITNLVARKLPPLPPPGSKVPHQLRFICAQALAADPNDRYPTAGEFQRALEDYLLDEPERALAEEELAAFMTRHFNAELQTARTVIEEHLQEVQAQSGRHLAPLPAFEPSEPHAALMPKAKTDEHEADTRVLEPREEPSRDGARETQSSGAPLESAPVSPSPIEQALYKLTSAAAPASPASPAKGDSGGHATASITTRTETRAARPARKRASAYRTILTSLSVVMAAAVLGVAGVSGLTEVQRILSGRAPGDAHLTRCGSGLKSCGGQCVSIDDPAHGCGAETCEACEVSNATPRCNKRGSCDVAACHAGFDDCDGDGKNGCETNVRIDPDHCTSCDRRCPALPNAERGCGDACTVWRCKDGFHDCNGLSTDGCEADMAADDQNCGRCGHACRPHHHCRSGICR